MGFDELTIKPLTYQTGKGYWKVNDRCFFEKAECLRYATSINNTNITFHFFDEIYRTLDWTKEPSKSLDELYRLRAQQLRDTHGYLMLSFSGGEDSKNILDVFLKNKIKLDEVVCHAPVKALEKLRPSFNPANKSADLAIFEYDLAIVPVLESLKITNPEIKITVIDSTERSIDYVLNCKLHTIDKHGYNPAIQYVGGLMVSDRQHQVKNSCIIMGTDKPRIVYDPKVNRFGQTFHDLAGVVNDFHDIRNNRHTVVEGFYYTPDMPEITLKQSIAIKRAMEPLARSIATNEKLKPLLGQTWPQGFIELNVHHPVLERMIYPNLDFPSWQSEKITSFFYMESGAWLTKGGLVDHKKVNDYFDGQINEFAFGVNDKFLVYKDGKPSHFKHYFSLINWL